MTNYLLNIEDSETTLLNVDHNMCFKMQFKAICSPFTLKSRECIICGINESETPLYDGLCRDCGKHYIYNEY